MKIAPESVRDLFDYSEGNLFWKQSNGRAKCGSRAGTFLAGYIAVRIARVGYKAHRLIWAWHHGCWPDIIDHINGNPCDNRIENLRSATHRQNSANAKRSCANTSGVKSVSWNKKDCLWRVSIRCEGELKYFGGFKDLELAELVSAEARQKHHGAFARME
jgi:hypothetical protein